MGLLLLIGLIACNSTTPIINGHIPSVQPNSIAYITISSDNEILQLFRYDGILNNSLVITPYYGGTIKPTFYIPITEHTQFNIKAYKYETLNYLIFNIIINPDTSISFDWRKN